MPNEKMFIKTILVTTIIAIIGGFAAGPSYGQATTSTEKFTVPLFGVDNSCGPNPEFVQLTGNTNVIVHMTTDANGGRHIVDGHHNFQNAKGVGQTTGTKYVFTSAGVDLLTNINQIGTNEFTAFSHGRLISQGSPENQLASFQFHIVIQPDGKITGEISNFKFDCKG